MANDTSWTPTRPLPPSPRPTGSGEQEPQQRGHVPPYPMPGGPAEAREREMRNPFPPNVLFRVRKSWLGKCILQKFDGDMIGGPPPGFYDVPYETGMGGFTIVRREELTKLIDRVETATALAKREEARREKRAAQQRGARKKKREDFAASQLARPGEDGDGS